MSLVLYGIPNCNTVKKAIDWLKENEIAHTFHNFKKDGVSLAMLREWSAQVGWETLLNKKGTTWRKLSPEQQAAATNATYVLQLLLENPSMIKRPVVVLDGKIITVGFNPEELQKLR